MRIFKTVAAVFVAIIIYGNISMLVKGEFTSPWNVFALLFFVLIEGLLITSLSKKKIKEENEG